MAALVELVEIEAPCKVNLSLSVGERRADGFHRIESIFAALSLRDTLSFEVLNGGGEDDRVIMDASELPPALRGPFSAARLPPEKNLVYRAIKLFKRETGFAGAVSARVYKRIPAGAGLGGGSSDAASALFAVNTLSGRKLPARRLAALAGELGSDAPFFAGVTANSCSAAFVSGRGERVAPVNCPFLYAVIVNPGFESGTKEAFNLLDTARASTPAENTSSRPFSAPDLLAALTKSPGEWPFYNDFLTVFMNMRFKDGVYTSILQDLRRNKAVFCGLSGSGSSCFGIFADADGAKAAAASLAARWPFVREAHTFIPDAGAFAGGNSGACPVH